MLKTQKRKRLESLLWRGGMMVLAFALDAAIKNLSGLKLNPETTIFIGLILGEVSKAIKSEIDYRKELKKFS